MSNNVWQGTRVRLRALEPGDWAAHWSWDQDAGMERSLEQIHFPRSQEAARQWATRTATQPPEGDKVHLVIENAAGELVGAVATHDCNRRTGTFAYGVAVRPEHQRQGYAAEAIVLLLRYFFQELRYQKVTVEVYSFNGPSIALHERLGFQAEGRLRRTVFTAGQFFDALLYGMTAEEFAARYPADPFPG
ncbi:MAG TPA: GNAT family protein [Chloroflexia bacterium]|nr:GNAT family protein [Chloroflexia bacterium]